MKKVKETSKARIFNKLTKHAHVLNTDERYHRKHKKEININKFPKSFKKIKKSSDVLFIGKKPLMAYVTSTLIQLANVPSVNIKARGLSIGRAVDVAQIVARKTENAGYSIGNIKIDSESLESEDGRTRNVSTIEIEVKRNAE